MIALHWFVETNSFLQCLQFLPPITIAHIFSNINAIIACGTSLQSIDGQSLPSIMAGSTEFAAYA